MDDVYGTADVAEGGEVKIAFVTREIAGLTKSGGIGTAVRYLCEHLVCRGGHEVHVYYTGRPDLRMPRFVKEMKTHGITVHALPLFAQSLTRNPRKKPRYVYSTLKAAKYDLYVFHEFMADGFFCFQAKKKGEAFAGIPLGIVTHGSSLWVDLGNGRRTNEPRRKWLYDMEKACCELADFLVSPSEFLLDWMREQSWNLPEASRCIPNFTSSPSDSPLAVPQKRLTGEEIREIVFFGRLAEIKGVRIFCDAINMLPPSLLTGRMVTFLGKEDHFSAKTIRSWLLPAQDKAGFALRFFTGYGSLEAREHLSRDGVLAVMPSLRENSPCTVSECLERGIPFLASSVGGGKELVHEEDRGIIFFPPQKEDLANRLRSILEREGAASARSSWEVKDIYQHWENALQRVII